MESMIIKLRERDLLCRNDKFTLLCEASISILKEREINKQLHINYNNIKIEKEEIDNRKKSICSISTLREYIIQGRNRTYSLKKNLEYLKNEKTKLDKIINTLDTEIKKAKINLEEVENELAIVESTKMKHVKQHSLILEQMEIAKASRDSLFIQYNTIKSELDEAKKKYQYYELQKSKLANIISGGFEIPLEKLNTNQIETNQALKKYSSVEVYDQHSHELYDAEALTIGLKYNYNSQIYDIQYSPVNPVIAIGGADRSLHLIDTDMKSTIRNINMSTGGVLAVAFSPAGKYCMAASMDRSNAQHNTVKLFDGRTGQYIQIEETQREVVDDCCFVTEESFVTCCRDGGLSLFDTRQRGIKNKVQCNSAARSLWYPQSSRYIISGHRDGCVRLWDMTSSKFAIEAPISKFPVVHVTDATINGECVAVTLDNRLHVFDKRHPELRGRTYEAKGMRAGDHTRVGTYAGRAFVGLQNGNIEVIDLSTMKKLSVMKGNHSAPVCVVTADSFNGMIASGDANGCVFLWS